MELNPFSNRAVRQRRGAKNFRNCNLKTTDTAIRSARNINLGPLRVVSTLEQCPTIEDRGMKAIQTEATNITSGKPEAQAANAQKRLERFCGTSICADCVYVGMETPVQVNLYRKEEALSRVAVAEAQKAALLAEAEVNALTSGVVSEQLLS